MKRSQRLAISVMLLMSAWLCSGGSPITQVTDSRASATLKKINDTWHETKISFACDISTVKKRIKKPLVLLIFLREDDGAWRYKACLADDSDRTANIRKITDIVDQSASQAEVDLEKYRRFQTTGEQSWSFSSPGKNKILAFRCELWIDGLLAGSFDSVSAIQAKQLGIPPDWYTEGKYPEKIIYGNTGNGKYD